MPSPRRVIAVVNQKGGVGKTAVSTNLAAAVAQSGGEVLAIDSDRQGNMASQLLPDGADYGLADVYTQLTTLQDAIVRSPTVGVDVVVPGDKLAQAELGMVGAVKREEMLARHLETLEDDVPLVIIDCPPNLGLLAVNAMTACTELLIPISMQDSESVTGLADVMATIAQLFGPTDQPPLRAILNRDQKNRRIAQRLSDGLAAHGVPLTTVRIPERTVFHAAPDDGLPAIVSHPDSLPATRFRELAAELELV